MIKNDKQLVVSKKALAKLEEGLKTLRAECKKESHYEMLSYGVREHIKQIKREIKEYEKIKSTPLPKVLRAQDPAELGKQFVRLRIGRKITQTKLAERMGCKPSDISRLERDDYQGYTLNKLRRLAKALNTKIEIRLIPDSKRAGKIKGMGSPQPA